MKPRLLELWKNRVVYDQNFNTTVSRPIWFRDQLKVPLPGVTNGDFSSPYSWSYNRLVQESLEGTSTTLVKRSSGLYDFWAASVGSQGVLVPLSISPGNLMAIAREQAYGELVEKVRGQIDLSVALLQGGQTASMVRSANRTLQYVRSFKKLRLKEAWRDFTRDGPIGKKVGSKWLEFQYGWKPLAQDAYNTAVELGRQFPAMMIVDVKKGFRKVESGTYLWVAFGTSWPTDNVCEGRYRIKARFQPNAAIENLLGNFTSLNPASIAWEMTPYSFVVDWFVDFGGYMRNLESFFLLRQSWKDGFEFEGTFAQTAVFATGTKDISSSYRQVSTCVGKTTQTTYDRRALIHMPMPAPPSFKANLSSGRLLNAAALISQHMR